MPKTYDPLLMLVALVAVVSIGIMLFPSMDTTDLIGNAFDKLRQKSVTRLSADDVLGYIAVFKSGDTHSIAILDKEDVHINNKLNGRLTHALRNARIEQIEHVNVREKASLGDMDVELEFYDKYGNTFTASTDEEESLLLADTILTAIQDNSFSASTLSQTEKEFYYPVEYIRQESKDYSVLTYDPNLHKWYFGDEETSMDFVDPTDEVEVIKVLAVDGDGNAYKIVNEALLDAISSITYEFTRPSTSGGTLVPPDEDEQRTSPEDDLGGIPVDLEEVDIEEEEDEPVEQTPIEIDPVEISEGEEEEEPVDIEIEEEDVEDEPVEIEVEEIPVECSEDDAGDDPSVKGYHTGTYPWGGETYMIPDSCRISTTNEKVASCTSEDCKLMEYYCVEDTADSKYGYLFWKFYEGVDCNNGATS